VIYTGQLVLWGVDIWERYGVKRNAYKILAGKSLRKRSLGRPKRRCENNNNMGLREIRCGEGRWMGLAQDHVQCRFFSSAIKLSGLLPENYYFQGHSTSVVICDSSCIKLCEN
jgi:hypothetical protein